MGKEIRALGMALAAVAALAAIARRPKQMQRAAAGYEEFEVCPSVTQCRTSELRGIENEGKETFELIKGGGAECKRGSKNPIILGTNCYVGFSGKCAVFTRELTASLASKASWNFSKESTENSDATNSFYEQNQLKDCLA